MAYTITSDCTACGLCLPECPIDAIIAATPIYVIDRALCCDFGDCVAVCPVNAIVRVEEGGDCWQEAGSGTDASPMRLY